MMTYNNNFFIDNSNNLNILYLNIRSIRKNWNSFLVEFSSCLAKLDIIVLVEINLTEYEVDFYKLDNFTSNFKTRHNRRGGGICVFVNNKWNYEVLSTQTFSYESLVLDICHNSNIISFSVIYRPPSNNVNDFITEFTHNTSKLQDNREVVIIGDFNINVLTKNSCVNNYLDCVSMFGLENIIKDYTRVDLINNSKTIIDHALLRVNKYQVVNSVFETLISDHYSIGITLSDILTQNTESNVPSVKYCVNKHKLNVSINSFDWNSLLTGDVDSTYNKICDKYNELTNEASFRKTNHRQNNRQPWITKTILENCKNRDKLYKKWKNNRCNKTYEKEYKIYRNKVNKEIFKSKQSYFHNLFVQHAKDPKNTWKLINKLRGKDKQTNKIIRNFKNTEPDFLANKFADHFSDEIINIVHECDICTLSTRCLFSPNSMFLEYATVSEVRAILLSLNINKGPGADNIRAEDLKNNANTFAPIITNIFNNSIDTSKIPTVLKKALVVPIYKSGVKDIVTNYRPISILSAINQIFEELFLTRLLKFIENNHLLSDKQYGFRKGKSTNSLLGEFSDKINTSLNKNLHTLVMFIDFSKAFDTLNHNKIIEKLYKVGIRGIPLKWLKNYLSFRNFKVKIESSKSAERNITHGVPQGSKLGPILFIIYINDLLNILDKSTVFAYADDISIIIDHVNLDSARDKMQNEIHKVVRWCHDNGLVLNAKKSKVMHIRQPHLRKTEISLKINSHNFLHEHVSDNYNDPLATNIEVIDEYKYLGVIIDYNFKWTKHIEHIRSKLRQSNHMLYNLNKYCTKQNLVQIYYGLVESYLSYGIIAWGTASKSLIKPIEKLRQNIIKKIKTTDSNNIYFLSIDNLYKSSLMREYYFKPEYRESARTHNLNTRSARNVIKYKVEKYNNNYGKRMKSHIIPTILNDLPQDIINLQNNSKSLKLIKNHYISIS